MDQGQAATASNAPGAPALLPECVCAAMRDGHELRDIKEWAYVNGYVTSSLVLIKDDVSTPGTMEFVGSRIERIERLLAAHMAVRS